MPLRRSRLRGILDWVLVAVLFGLCALMVARLDEVSLRNVAGAVRVVDGDTLEIAGQRVRLSGIDAFERDQSCRRDNADYACGLEAHRALAALARDGGVSCAGRTVDRWGRLLAVCEARGRDLNALMVESGWALAWGGYDGEEQSARLARRGAWGGEFATPADWRAGRGEPAEPRQDWLRRVIDLIVQLFTGRGGEDG
ncbi:MAG: thermonuclease family protein [Rhizobiaceae bacterium]|nr:thermonuclease family protein [Rhizobiaceae bacterium]